MTSEELDRLAALIARELERSVGDRTRTQPEVHKGTWLPLPVRPEVSGPRGEPPVWSAAAQPLGDVAPVRRPEAPARRAGIGEATAAIRAAAAGQAPPRTSTAGSSPRAGGRSRARGGTIEVPVGVSNRHIHLSEADAAALFGKATLEVGRVLKQPGQYAAEARVNVLGPTGRIDGVRVVGPARGATQLELALSDLATLGVGAPVANSGRLDASAGGVAVEGPHGTRSLSRGVIVAARHLHLSPADGARWHLRDGDLVAVRCGEGPRATTWHGVLVRCGEAHATEFHLDADEARAAGVDTGATAYVTSVTPAPGTVRRLVTERDVVALASRGEALPERALLTPSARDRARALGLQVP